MSLKIRRCWDKDDDGKTSKNNFKRETRVNRNTWNAHRLHTSPIFNKHLESHSNQSIRCFEVIFFPQQCITNPVVTCRTYRRFLATIDNNSKFYDFLKFNYVPSIYCICIYALFTFYVQTPNRKGRRDSIQCIK